ncbi:Uncharacterised protein [Legionella beliardensis]|uniref:Uncharacterized protein n=1 Tax=Legionella beliardensis TaxID=91822 RepID=A0A378I041_9GAMM|nr:hypothetical protein [Legionella beliardensis]STX28557.1 Uncharacterised protein [Legionella beliardensis]
MKQNTEINYNEKEQEFPLSKDHWEKYNKKGIDEKREMVRYENGVMTATKSYSHLFF